MGPLTILFFAALGTVIIAGVGFILGLSQQKIVNKDDATLAVQNYDATLALNEIVVSNDGLCAIATAKDNSLLLINSMGDELSARRIQKSDIRGKGNQIEIKLDDLGFAPIKKPFNPDALENLLSKVS